MKEKTNLSLSNLRSILFVPADRTDLIAKAASGAADAVCMDLEDAVSSHQKEAARHNLKAAATLIRSHGKPVIVRINNEPDLIEDDIVAAAPSSDAIVLPKAGSPAACAEFRARLDAAAPARLALIAQVETASGLLTFSHDEIGGLAGIIDALTIGPEDLADNLNCNPGDSPVCTGMDMLAMAASASRIPLFGFPGSISEFTDIERFAGIAEVGKRAGAVGAFCIHPKQIEPLHRIFSPTLDEIDNALKVIAAFEQAHLDGIGAVKLDGKMVDLPVYKRALSTLQRRKEAPLAND